MDVHARRLEHIVDEKLSPTLLSLGARAGGLSAEAASLDRAQARYACGRGERGRPCRRLRRHGPPARGLRCHHAAARNMACLHAESFAPDPEAYALYEQLYAEYVTLHDYFGRGANDVMKRLKQLRGGLHPAYA